MALYRGGIWYRIQNHCCPFCRDPQEDTPNFGNVSWVRQGGEENPKITKAPEAQAAPIVIGQVDMRITSLCGVLWVYLAYPIGSKQMVGCQNYGRVFGAYYSTAPNLPNRR